MELFSFGFVLNCFHLNSFIFFIFEAFAVCIKALRFAPVLRQMPCSCYTGSTSTQGASTMHINRQQVKQVAEAVACVLAFAAIGALLAWRG
jgi:hypothetical protein